MSRVWRGGRWARGVGEAFVLAVAAWAGLACSSGDAPPEAGASAMPGMEMEGAAGQDASMDGMQMDGTDMGGMSTDAAIRLRASDIQTFGITFGKAEVRPLERTVRANGIVEFDETRMAFVSPKFAGWAERLHVDFTGAPVERGDPLLEVYAPQLVTAQEELLLATRMSDEVRESTVDGVASSALQLAAAARRRLGYWDISEAQIDRILETGEVQRTLTLHAPISGIVVEKNVVEGQAFREGESLYMIAGLSEVWVNAEIFESDAPYLRQGMPVGITVDALPGRTFAGRVEFVYPTLDARTRSLRARVALQNPGEVLKPGMYATMRLAAGLGRRLTVPTDAVLFTGERAVAFVSMEDGRMMPHELELGVRGDGVVEVLSGLEEGDRVVTSAQFLLDSESNLAEVMQAMMIQMGMSGGDMEGMDMGGEDPGGMEGMDMDGPGEPSDSTGGP